MPRTYRKQFLIATAFTTITYLYISFTTTENIMAENKPITAIDNGTQIVESAFSTSFQKETLFHQSYIINNSLNKIKVNSFDLNNSLFRTRCKVLLSGDGFKSQASLQSENIKLQKFMINLYDSSNEKHKKSKIKNVETRKASSNDFFKQSNVYVTEITEYLQKELFPLSKRNIRIYSNNDAYKCFKYRKKKLKRPLKLTFIGDSQVRNIMETIIEYISPRVKLKITLPNHFKLDDFLNKKIKKDVVVRSDNLILHMIWRTSILGPGSEGIGSIFNQWLVTPGLIPDLVLMDTGLWELKNHSEIDAINSVIYKIGRVLPSLLNISKKLNIIWVPNGPMKYWLATDFVPNAALHFINNFLFLKLQNSNIWFWESSLMVFQMEHELCRMLHKEKKSFFASPKRKKISLLCGDFMHSSKHVTGRVLVNILLNLLCNSFMQNVGDKFYDCSQHH